MVTIVCDQCGNKWDYTGDRPEGTYVDCPECGYRVEIEPYEE